ncbi:hypothetical protein ADIMK_0212 [Marinobacterium lacunae]|uniref:Uncharacterized protein n=1 Tax=Marinobacterium lacunae TaxID=1232683 RepID=A0A081G481_9GAMM|nr:hypothetical protein [Marinobacterium lacunae]KEA65586.1 hypothetical protein ADIMK_0212 [Marinobacterium lacunae]
MSTDNVNIDREGLPPEVIYVVNMTSKEMYCGGLINGMEQLDNLSTKSGTVMMGFNATAFLKKGVNKMELGVVPLDARNGMEAHREGARCETTLKAAFKDNDDVELTSLLATEESGVPTIKSSKLYPDEHKSPLVKLEGETDGYLTMFEREFYVKTIPEWAWTRATPFVEERENMKMLRKAYTDLLELIRKKDFKALEAAWSLSSREKAMAEGYQSTPEEFYSAVAIESGFSLYEDVVVKPIGDWGDYKLKSFMGGKLVRLENSRGSSPLRIFSESHDWLRTFTPYFSLIDGRLVISR